MSFVNPAILKHEAKALDAINNVYFSIGDPNLRIGVAPTLWNYQQPPRPFYQDMSRPVQEKIGMSYARIRTNTAPKNRVKRTKSTMPEDMVGALEGSDIEV